VELAAIYLPKELVEEAKRRGLDLEAELLDYLAARLELNPTRRAELHLALAERLFEEGARLVNADPVQASEKLYKAAEECVKALAELLELKDILERVRGRGRWTVTDLERAVARASDLLGQDLAPSWDAANYLHVWGFHEAELDVSAIRRRVPSVRELLEAVKRAIRALMARMARI